MKLLIAVCLVAIVGALPPPRVDYSRDDVQITKYENDNIGLGNYRYAFEQSDGTKQEQRGEIINEGKENESLVVTGSFTWIGPDGVLYTIRYTAGEKGYEPEIEQGPGGAIPDSVASIIG